MIRRRDFVLGGVSGLMLAELAKLSPVFGRSGEQAVAQGGVPSKDVPLPQLGPLVSRPAPTVFSSPFGNAVDDQEDYLVILKSPSRGVLNNYDPQATPTLLTDIEISGKKVVFAGGSRPFTDCDGSLRKDLRKLVIIADELEIREPVWLPQTSVEIYARTVTFLPGATLTTTPIQIATPPLRRTARLTGRLGTAQTAFPAGVSRSSPKKYSLKIL